MPSPPVIGPATGASRRGRGGGERGEGKNPPKAPHGRALSAGLESYKFHGIEWLWATGRTGSPARQGLRVTGRRRDMRVPAPQGNTRRVRCCVSLLAGFLAVAVNLIAALVMGPMAPSMQAGARFDVASAAAALDGSGPQGGVIPICSAQGTRWVTSDGNPALPPPGSGGHSDLCAFCLPLTSGGVTAPAEIQIKAALPPVTVVAYPAVAGTPADGAGLNPSARPRAPPALV